MAREAVPAGTPHEARQRIDKWLWFARVAKSRSLAARMVEEGFVRINSKRIEDAAKVVKVGDTVTIALERDVRVLRVLGGGVRRGPYAVAKLLFEDLSEGGSDPTD